MFCLVLGCLQKVLSFRFPIIILLAVACLGFSACLGGGQIPFTDDPNKTLCASDSDCSPLEICQFQLCESRTPSCIQESDCPEGALCSSGLCLKPGVCYLDPQCPKDYRCEDYRCVPDRCESDLDCTSSQICSLAFGLCQAPPCLADSDCGVGECCNPFSAKCVDQLFCEQLGQSIPPDCVPEPELCDYQDNDCDGAIDEDFPTLGANCSAGEGLCLRLGNQQCLPDGSGMSCDAVPGPPQIEVCDGVDNDCDGGTDEGC